MSICLLPKQNAETFAIFVHSCSEQKTTETQARTTNINLFHSLLEHQDDQNNLNINSFSAINPCRKNKIKRKARDSITSSTFKVTQEEMHNLLKKLKEKNKRKQSSCSSACIII